HISGTNLLGFPIGADDCNHAEQRSDLADDVRRPAGRDPSGADHIMIRRIASTADHSPNPKARRVFESLNALETRGAVCVPNRSCSEIANHYRPTKPIENGKSSQIVNFPRPAARKARSEPRPEGTAG